MPDPTPNPEAMPRQWRIRDLLRIQLGLALVLGVGAIGRQRHGGFVVAVLFLSTWVYVYARVMMSSFRAFACSLIVATVCGAAFAQHVLLDPWLGACLGLVAGVGWGLVWGWSRPKPPWMKSLAAHIDRQARKR